MSHPVVKKAGEQTTSKAVRTPQVQTCHELNTITIVTCLNKNAVWNFSNMKEVQHLTKCLTSS